MQEAAILLLTDHGFYRFHLWKEAYTFARDLGLDPEKLVTDQQLVRADAVALQLTSMFKVLKLIPRSGKGTAGRIDCPRCRKGTVHWSRSSYNGHLWAHCTTPGCFAVMQ